MSKKLKAYQVGENDIVAATSKKEARQILADYCGEKQSDEFDVIEMPLTMVVNNEEGEFLETLAEIMGRTDKAEYLFGWE